MLKSVLIPLDGSALAEGIIPVVHRLLSIMDAKAVLLHVLVGKPDKDSTPAQHLLAVRTYLEGLASSLEAEGIKAGIEVRAGDPAEEIVRAAEEDSPDLIAISTHGWTGFKRLVRGSVAERVLRQSKAPVLMANPSTIQGAEQAGPPPVGFERILVALDGSDRSARVIPLATEIARIYDGRITLFYVSPLPVDLAGATELRPFYVGYDAGEAEKMLEPYAEKIRASGVPVDVKAVTGVAADEILHAVERESYDLLALTTHGRSGVSRWLLGSVAENVLRHCPIPTLVIRTA